MALKERKVVLVSKDAQGNTCMDMPLTTVDQVEGAVKSVNGGAPDENGNVTVEIVNEETIKSIVLNAFFPVGSIYMDATGSIDPNTQFGGQWDKINDAFLYGSGAKGVGATGGAETVTLTVDQMPEHTHSGSTSCAGSHNHGAMWDDTKQAKPYYGYYFNTNSYTGTRGSIDDRNTMANTSTNGSHTHTINMDNTGGGQSHENMPPYLAVNIWKRID